MDSDCFSEADTPLLDSRARSWIYKQTLDRWDLKIELWLSALQHLIQEASPLSPQTTQEPNLWSATLRKLSCYSNDQPGWKQYFCEVSPRWLELSLMFVLSPDAGPMDGREPWCPAPQLAASGFPGQQFPTRTHGMSSPFGSWKVLVLLATPPNSALAVGSLLWPPKMSSCCLSHWVALAYFSRWNASGEGGCIGLNTSLEKSFSLSCKNHRVKMLLARIRTESGNSLQQEYSSQTTQRHTWFL